MIEEQVTNQENVPKEKTMYIGVWQTNDGNIFNTIALDSKEVCNQQILLGSRFCKKENWRQILSFTAPND